ncbi:MAG: hypothetical protein ACE5LL_07275 [Alphaproteobacteria bacterium]
MGAGKAKTAVDWAAVEREYRTGAAPVKEIARRHGVSPSALYRRARKENWQREAGARKAGKKARSGAPASDLRHDLARLRALAEKLRVRLERVIEGKGANSVLGEREGAVGLLVKLCQVTEKIIALERQLEGQPAGVEAMDLSEHDKAILERFKRRLRAP